MACTLDFAVLAANNSDGRELTAAAYFQLWERLGARVSPVTLERVISSQSPFDIPEDADGDVFALRGKTKELEQLVRLKGWDTPDLRSHLIETLREQLNRRKLSRLTTAVVKENAEPFIEAE